MLLIFKSSYTNPGSFPQCTETACAGNSSAQRSCTVSATFAFVFCHFLPQHECSSYIASYTGLFEIGAGAFRRVKSSAGSKPLKSFPSGTGGCVPPSRTCRQTWYSRFVGSGTVSDPVVWRRVLHTVPSRSSATAS